MAYQYIQVPGTNILLHTDPELESTRARLFGPILKTHGRRFKHRRYDSSYPVGSPTIRCFDQAMQLSRQTGLAYVEGFMVFQLGNMPYGIGHAWCSTPDGEVQDPTCWKYLGNPLVAFFGVPIKTEYHEKWEELVGYYGLMDGLWDGRRVHTFAGIYKDPPDEWLRKEL